jgi:hypothetical protein
LLVGTDIRMKLPLLASIFSNQERDTVQGLLVGNLISEPAISGDLIIDRLAGSAHHATPRFHPRIDLKGDWAKKMLLRLTLARAAARLCYKVNREKPSAWGFWRKQQIAPGSTALAG